jgi:hypothetical protein
MSNRSPERYSWATRSTCTYEPPLVLSTIIFISFSNKCTFSAAVDSKRYKDNRPSNAVTSKFSR